MKKVGIMSMQRIKNYGSFLQAYALKRIVEELHYEVQFVDYHIEKTIVEFNKQTSSMLKKVIEVLRGKAKLKYKIQYLFYKKNFDNYFKLLGLNNYYNFNPELNTLLIGSDEVFNIIQSNKKVGYSLELLGKNNNAEKLISYAASFGNTTFEKIIKYDKLPEISSLLCKFDNISVRDQNSFDIVKKMTGRDAQINLDPVLIYNYMDSDLVPSLDIKEKYLLVYAYNNRISKEEAKQIKKFACSKKLKIYSIGGVHPYIDKFINCSPFEVLAYFKNSEYVVTDTFHGTIFSIINSRPFVTLIRNSIENSYGNMEKISYLLNQLDLVSRIAKDFNYIDGVLESKISYDKVKKIIEVERKRTIDYLKNSL